jgi:hypothetical protein
VESVDASGPLLAVLVVACLFYLVPRQLKWRIPTQEEVEQQTPLHLSMKTVHSGTPNTPENVQVSTILMRRAGRRLAHRLARKAEKRRRGVFLALLLITLATVPVVILGWMGWWVPVGGLGVIIAWAVFSHIEARRTQKQLDAIVAETELGDAEKTIAVQIHTVPEVGLGNDEPGSVVGPNGDVQLSLWDPITVVPATYISTPTAARTVRTIDLGAPKTKLPVTDDRRNEEGQAIAV